MDSKHRDDELSVGGAADAEPLCPSLSPDFNDPESWMAERPRYWAELAATRAPTRTEWLRHRLFAWWEALRAHRRGAQQLGEGVRTPEAVWQALFEAAVGPLGPGAAAVVGVVNDVGPTPPDDKCREPAEQTAVARARPRRFALDAPRDEGRGPPDASSIDAD